MIISTKFSRFISLCCLGLFLIAMDAHAQERGHKKTRVSPNAGVTQTIGNQQFKITYGRPSVNGRKIYGGLVPYDKPWRTGANESTDIVIPTDVMVEGQSLKAGMYSVYTIPGKKKWTVIFNSKLSWGTEYDQSKDVLRVDVKPEQGPKREQLLIYFRNVTDQSAEVVIHWNKTRVPFSINL